MIDTFPEVLYLDVVLRRIRRNRLLGTVALLVVLLLPSRSVADERGTFAPEAEVVRARWLMGTVLELRLPAGTQDADSLAEAAFAEVSRVEAAASLWRPGTELAAVHARAAAGEAVVLSETLGELRPGGAPCCRPYRSGAYSPAVGALVSAYDLRGDGRWPSEAERLRAVALARPEGVRYDPRPARFASTRASLSTSTALPRDSLSTARRLLSGPGESKTRS